MGGRTSSFAGIQLGEERHSSRAPLLISLSTMGTAERKDQNIETYPRCCLCHRRPTPLAQHYYENIWNYSSAYLWKIYPCIVSRIAKPNNVCQLRIDGERVEKARRKRDRGIDEDLSLSLSISLLEISCNFDSRGVQVSRGREIFGTPARIVVDGSTRDERIDACQFRYYFSWGSILFLLS